MGAVAQTTALPADTSSRRHARGGFKTPSSRPRQKTLRSLWVLCSPAYRIAQFKAYRQAEVQFHARRLEPTFPS